MDRRLLVLVLLITAATLGIMVVLYIKVQPIIAKAQGIVNNPLASVAGSLF